MTLFTFGMSRVLVQRLLSLSVPSIMSLSFIVINRMWESNVNKVGCFSTYFVYVVEYICIIMPWSV